MEDGSGNRHGSDEESGEEKLIRFAGGELITFSVMAFSRATRLCFSSSSGRTAQGEPRRCFGHSGLGFGPAPRPCSARGHVRWTEAIEFFACPFYAAGILAQSVLKR